MKGNVIYYDPVNGLIKLCEKKYGLKCVISFNKRLRNLGRTTFYKKGLQRIELSTKLNIIGILDVLSHEIAHVVRGAKNMDHGKEWKKIYNDIYKSYCGSK
jgi:predicted SprT family Zn-dependent metalloprotease